MHLFEIPVKHYPLDLNSKADISKLENHVIQLDKGANHLVEGHVKLPPEWWSNCGVALHARYTHRRDHARQCVTQFLELQFDTADQLMLFRLAYEGAPQD